MASSVKATFRANRSGINAACRLPGVYDNLERRMFRVKSAAIATVNNRTFEYARGLEIKRFRAKGGMAGVRLTATAGHSATLEHGSRPHIIEPKDKQALAWPGGLHPVKRVHHPGTPAQHVLRNALRAAGR
jgi:hypothetical protein